MKHISKGFGGLRAFCYAARMNREQSEARQYSSLFLKQIQRLKKKYFLIWGGVFVANVAYALLAYFVEPPFGIHEGWVKTLPWFAGIGVALSFFLYNRAMQSDQLERRLQVLVSEGLMGKIMGHEDLAETAQLPASEQKVIFILNGLYPTLALCWGLNEVIGFLGVLNSLVADAAFDVSVYYFLIAISLNIAMYPPFHYFLDKQKMA